MKKGIIYINILFSFIILLLCSCDPPIYMGERPVEYPYSVWENDEYNISIQVKEINDYVCTIKIDEQLVEFNCFFYINSKYVQFTTNNNGLFIEITGVCDFNPEYCIIKITKSTLKKINIGTKIILNRIE